MRLIGRLRPCARKLASVEARIEPKKRGEGKTVLIVDDNPLVCKAIEGAFLSDGFEVCVAAENGDLAIEAAKECRPDLIILDLSMPLWNGLQAAPMLRRLFPKAPIFLYSLYADAVDKQTATEAGLDLVISKDEPPTSVVSKAHELMGGQR
jgi:DNA-binding NarL/FixJ family response regulator